MFEDEVVAAAAQLHAASTRLAEAFRTQQPGTVAAEVLTEVLAAVRQGELITCLAVERVDRTGEFAADGAASTTSYLRGVANETWGWASLRVRLGRALVDRLPATRAAWEAGRLGLAHAWQIVQATKDIDDPDQVTVLDTIFAQATPALSPTELKKLGDRIRAQETPDQAAKKTADQRSRQTLSLAQTMDGMWDLHGRLDPEAGTLVKNVLDAFTPRPSADKAIADPGAGLTPGQRRAAALVEICRQAQDHAEGCHRHSGGRNTLIVTVPLQDLQSGVGVGDVAGGATLPAATLRRWACDTGIIPMVLGADSEILDFGRRRRTVSAGQRAYLVARDGGCAFPGCDRPPSWTEAHHIQRYADGGRTDVTNLHLLCLAHHHLVHEGGWTITITQNTAKTLLFHPPDGRPPIPGQRKPLSPAPRHHTHRSTHHSRKPNGIRPSRT